MRLRHWFAALSVAAASLPALACGRYEVALYELGALYMPQPGKAATGIDKDVVDELARRTGCRFQQTADARAKIWLRLADGSLDMSVSGIPTPEREKFARFLIYFQTRNHLIVREEVAPRIDSLRAFYADERLRLAVVRTFRHGKGFDAWIDTLRAQGRVTEYLDPDAAAAAVAKGQAEAFLSLPVAWGPILRRQSLEGRVAILDVAPDDRVPHGLILSRKRVSEADAERMREALDAMRRDGTLERIYQRYMDADLARRILP